MDGCIIARVFYTAAAIASLKEELEKLWRLTKDRPSPNVSPGSSDVEVEVDEPSEKKLEYESDLETIEADN